MSDIRELVLDASKAVLEAHCTRQALDDACHGRFPKALWDALEAAGIPWALVAEARAGAGLSVQDAGALVRQAAYYAAPVPLAETVLATWLLEAAGLDIPTGPLTVAFMAGHGNGKLTRAGDEWTVRGTVSGVPWARDVSALVVVLEDDHDLVIAALPAGNYSVQHAVNLADEPRDTVEVECRLPLNALAKSSSTGLSVAYELGAALRTAQISGALQRALELSVSYTMDRRQFGRPLAKFQAVQHNLAMLAGQAAAANGAAELALAVATKADATVPIAAAKARASEAATVGAALAHQLHGAIGVTSEYALHHYTQRLWSWRDEFGGESYWWEKLGRSMLSGGADDYWRRVCEVDDLVAGRL